MNGDYIRILDGELRPTVIIDDYVSLKYTAEFCGPGSFECVLSRGRAVPALPFYVMCRDGGIFVVEERRFDEKTILLRGTGVLSLFGRRVIPRVSAVKSEIENAVCDLVYAYGRQALPAGIRLSGYVDGGGVDFVTEAGNLLSRITSYAASVGKGLSLTFDPEDRRFLFAVYSGTDRRLTSSVAEPILLSDALGNIKSATAETSLDRYLNSVTVRGAERANAIPYEYTLTASQCDFGDGFDDGAYDLREGYVRSSIGVSLYTAVVDGEEVFDLAGYSGALRERARQELAAHRPRRMVTATLPQSVAALISPGDVCSLRISGVDVTSVRVESLTRQIKENQSVCTAVLKAV